MPELFLEGVARPLLVLHAIVAIALGGASTHLALVTFRIWQRKSSAFRLVGIYAKTVGILFVVDFLIGLLIYPTYRYRVRGLYFDRYEPWAANLFDMKEILLGLALPLAFGLVAVCGKTALAERSEYRPWAALVSGLLWAFVAFGIVSGLLVTTVRSV